MDRDTAFEIRLATAADVDALTELHCACLGPQDHVPVILGKEYVRATYRWQVGGGEAYTLVADRAGRLIGLLGVCDRSYAWPLFRACLGSFLAGLVRNPLLLLNRRLWRRLLHPLGATDAPISTAAPYSAVAQMIICAVDTGFRGVGVFAALVEGAKEMSRSRGSQAIRAGVYRANSSSRRAFEKAGWVALPAPSHVDTVSYWTDLASLGPAEAEDA
jgi:GNAT superfamily N-acetyltransferase